MIEAREKASSDFFTFNTHNVLQLSALQQLLDEVRMKKAYLKQSQEQVDIQGQGLLLISDMQDNYFDHHPNITSISEEESKD